MKTRIILACLMASAFSFGIPVVVNAQEEAPRADFGDHSSETLTSKAWDALGARQYALALVYADKSIEMYQSEALEQQAALTEPAPVATASEHWALNDVGTCYFIKAQVLEAQGKKSEALEAYRFLAENLRFAQCWDTRGWFWSPAEAASKRVAEMEFELLD